MRIKSLLNLVFVLIAAQLLFACNSTKYYEFAATKDGAYGKVKQKPSPNAEVETNLSDIALAAAEEKAAKAEPVLEATIATTPAVKAVAPKSIAKIVPETEASANSITEAEAMAMAKERIATMTKAEKRELKKEVKEAFKQSGTTTSIVEIILAIILPPLAVFLHDGIGTSFWINIILTLLFFLPGIIHALLVVTDTI